MKTRGFVIAEWLVGCGICEGTFPDEDRHLSYKNFLRSIKEGGFSYTKKHGWVCPDCLNRTHEKES